VYDLPSATVVRFVSPSRFRRLPSPMKLPTLFRTIAIAVGVVIASTAQGQRPNSASQTVPANLRPPAGMCRIWVDGVAPGRQPAPTDCASALRNRPPKGRVIFGDDFAHGDSSKPRMDTRSADSPLKGLAPLPRSLDPRSADPNPAGGKPDEGAAKPDEGRKKPDARKPAPHKPDSTSVTVPHGPNF